MKSKKAWNNFYISIPYLVIIIISIYLNESIQLHIYKSAIMITALIFFIRSIWFAEIEEKQQRKIKALIKHNKKKIINS